MTGGCCVWPRSRHHKSDGFYIGRCRWFRYTEDCLKWGGEGGCLTLGGIAGDPSFILRGTLVEFGLKTIKRPPLRSPLTVFSPLEANR